MNSKQRMLSIRLMKWKIQSKQTKIIDRRNFLRYSFSSTDEIEFQSKDRPRLSITTSNHAPNDDIWWNFLAQYPSTPSKRKENIFFFFFFFFFFENHRENIESNRKTRITLVDENKSKRKEEESIECILKKYFYYSFVSIGSMKFILWPMIFGI